MKRLLPSRRHLLARLTLEDGPSEATLSTWQPEQCEKGRPIPNDKSGPDEPGQSNTDLGHRP